MHAHDNIACRWFDRVWNDNDVDAIASMTTPDLRAHGADGVTRTRETFLEFQRAFKTALPDLRVTVRHTVEGRDMIAVQWTATGTHTGAVDGMPAPSGKTIEVSGLTLVRIENGRCAEGWDDYDAVGLMRQLGAAV